MLDLGTAEADVAQQAVVELGQVAALRARSSQLRS
jgi:hypothetical protein